MQCEHGACACEAREGDRWCSDHCRNAARDASYEERCGCGHAECEQETG